MNVAHKGHIANAMLPAQFVHGIGKRRAHQQIALAFDSHFRARETFVFRIGDDFQRGGFAALLHVGKEVFHLFQRKRLFLHAPEPRL